MNAEVMEYIALFRTVWIRGRLGFGKTALATLIAKRLLEDGLADGVVTNYPTVLPNHVSGVDDGTLLNRVEVWDEAWQDMDARTSMTNDRSVGAYLRRWGTYLILPSVHPVDRRLRAVEIAPSHKNIITGKTIWNFIVNDGSKEPYQGSFAIDIKQAYGLYSTSYIPVSDCGLLARFRYTYYMETGQHYDNRSNTQRQQAEVAALAGLAVAS
jgi:hypothetical protein